jgi:hypothetical protein
MPHVALLYLLPPVPDLRGIPLAPVTAAACPGRGSSSRDGEVLP